MSNPGAVAMARKVKVARADLNLGPAPWADQCDVQVLARAAKILRLLKGGPQEITLAEIGRRLDLPRTTVHRIVSALLAEQMIEQIVSSGHLRLGREFLQMTDALRDTLTVGLRPILDELSRDVNETVNICVLDRGGALVVEEIVARHRLCAMSMVGTCLPVDCAAAGKALLAALPPVNVGLYLAGSPWQAAAGTAIDRSALELELKEIRKSGVAFDIEECCVGICAVSVIAGYSLAGPAAISVPIPTQRFYEKREQVLHALANIVSQYRTVCQADRRAIA